MGEKVGGKTEEKGKKGKKQRKVDPASKRESNTLHACTRLLLESTTAIDPIVCPDFVFSFLELGKIDGSDC